MGRGEREDAGAAGHALRVFAQVLKDDAVKNKGGINVSVVTLNKIRSCCIIKITAEVSFI